MSTEPPPPVEPPVRWARKRLPFEGDALAKQRLRGGKAWLLALAAFAFGGLAVYMSVIQQRPLSSMYVVAPAIGAIWFALRLFMTIGPKT